MPPVLRVLAPGQGVTLQDLGRPGWGRFGVPPGGVMDRFSAAQANRLAGNPAGAPVLEILLPGAAFEVLTSTWLALAGAGNGPDGPGDFLPAGCARRMTAGATLTFPRPGRGVWAYLAIPGGWEAPTWFGSASVLPAAGLGQALAPGCLLSAPSAPGLFPRVAGRRLLPVGRRDFDHPPVLRLHPGPQWADFSPAARRLLVETAWTVSPRSDRTGYRLGGPPLPAAPPITSEPVLAGSVQVPENGQPIITQPDGPTVGGYPKIALLEEADRDWLAQCRPGVQVRFQWNP